MLILYYPYIIIIYNIKFIFIFLLLPNNVVNCSSFLILPTNYILIHVGKSAICYSFTLSRLLVLLVLLLRCVWGVSGVFIGDVIYCITVYCVVVGVLVGILSRNTYVHGAGFSVRETHTNSPYFVQSTPER